MPDIEIKNTSLKLYDPASVEIMGVINVTPDSFSDGGRFYDATRAIEQGLRLAEEGADILDIGGESSRPGAEPVGVEEELRRVIPVIEALADQVQIPLSIDTYKSKVAKEALEAGADIINDISAMTFDEEMISVAAHSQCGVILMHIQGTPRDMQKNPTYKDLLGEIADYLQKRVRIAALEGVSPSRIWVDPGLGFGKRQTANHQDNLNLLANMSRFRGIGAKLVVGSSRKSFIGSSLGDVPTEARLFGSLGTFAWAALFGADILRVHDVRPTVEMLKLMGDIYAQIGKRG